MGLNVDLLKQIVAGTVTFVSKDDALPLLSNNPPLIEVNPANLDASGNAQCRATPAAQSFIDAQGTAQVVTGADVGTLPTSVTSKAPAHTYALIAGVTLPDAKKRGNSSGSGAPTKYPFADMPVDGAFFSADSEHAKNDAVKALGSTVSSQNRKYAVEVKDEAGAVKTKTVTRAVRDKKTHKALLNADGSKQTETVTLPVLDYTRKFTIRPVIGGQKYGDWIAPSNGALVGRTK